MFEFVVIGEFGEVVVFGCLGWCEVCLVGYCYVVDDLECFVSGYVLVEWVDL